jgi:hypothetical protein
VTFSSRSPFGRILDCEHEPLALDRLFGNTLRSESMFSTTSSVRLIAFATGAILLATQVLL